MKNGTLFNNIHIDPESGIFPIVEFRVKRLQPIHIHIRHLQAVRRRTDGFTIKPNSSRHCNEILDEAMSRLPFNLQICINYVDDLFMTIPCHLLSYTLYIFNSVHRRIQFTYETEANGKLPYLDVLMLQCRWMQMEQRILINQKPRRRTYY